MDGSAKRLEGYMEQKIRQEEARTPLSTASLAHVDERREPENRASERTRDPLPRREPEGAVREADGRLAEGRPALVQPGTPRHGEARDQNRIENAGMRQPGEVGNNIPEEERNTPLFSDHESKDLFAKWDALQVQFIDEPRRAVEQADHMVAAAMKRTAEIFAEERARLERQWDRGDNVSTEDLRIAMRRYRSFFRRLLSL
jgi:hypothetical protein